MEIAQDANNSTRMDIFMQNGRLLKLPVGFKLPSCTAETAWQNWMLEDTINRIPKLRNCSGLDFSDKNQQKGSAISHI